MSDDLWIFGYGSLVFRPDFDFAERVVGKVEGYERRFWQASVDHRGTPDSPGRVVTLVEQSGGECWGVAYLVRPQHRDEVVEMLDHREKGGYSLVDLPFLGRPRGKGPESVSVYVGHEDNPQYCGPEDEETTAAIVRDAVGPSGHNAEYVVKLAEALTEMDVLDPHVLRLANLVVDPADVLNED